MSSNFSPIERFLAHILSYSPGIKKNIKWLYQYLNFLMHRKGYLYQSKFNISSVDNSTAESFFGYYDKSPENSTGEFTIFQSTTYNTRKNPNKNKSITLKLKENKTGEIIEIGKSYTYNWQQGTKLQWLSDYSFIYNFYDKQNDAYKSKIVDTKSLKEREISQPIYDCYKDEYALSLNFDRLAELRPDYGYRSRKENNLHNIDDGVFYVDLMTNTSRLLISIEQLKSISPQKTMNNAKHKVNHIMISPSGNIFMFMHRWLSQSGKRYDRLLISDKDGSNIKVVADEGMVSHCCWYNDETIIGYLKHISHGAAFYKIDVKENRTSLLSEKLLQFGDGHPTFHGNIMVFDTYPDRSRLKHLYLYDLFHDSVEEIGQFYESLKFFQETRCDLHPKWNFNGGNIYIDSVHEGKRNLYEIKLK